MPHERYHAPFPLPPRRTGRADLPHPALRRAAPPEPRTHPTTHPSSDWLAASATSEPVMGFVRPYGQSPDSWSLPPHARSQAPSLPRRYPASTVLRACPPPLGGPACPSRASGLGEVPAHRWGFPCCVRSPCADMPSPLPRWDRSWDRFAPLKATTTAFPESLPGRLPHWSFRGLLSVHARYGLPARGTA